jgi:hypothetical protein
MQRRDVLKGGALLGAGAIGTSAAGCATSGFGAGADVRVPPPDMAEFLAHLDERMQAIDRADFVREFTQQAHGKVLTDAQRAALEPREVAFRKMLRSLYLTQTFRDLPEESQLHPQVQAHMQSHIGEVNETVFGVTEMLEKLSDDERNAARDLLKRAPELGMKISEVVDEQAALARVSAKRRVQLRSMMTQTSFRLRHQPPAQLIDEYVHKAHKAMEQGGARTEALMRLTANASSSAFWAQQAQLSRGTAPAGSASGSASEPASASPTSVNEPPTAPATAPHAGSGTIKTGAILLGIGVITFLGSTALVALGAVPFVVGMTVGAVLFAIGLVMIIVGAIIYAAS